MDQYFKQYIFASNFEGIANFKPFKFTFPIGTSKTEMFIIKNEVTDRLVGFMLLCNFLTKAYFAYIFR